MKYEQHLSKRDIQRQRYGDISGNLMDKGMPATTAFTMVNAFLFLRKRLQKQIKVDHHETIKKQLEKSLDTGFSGIINLTEIEDSQNLPEQIDYQHIRENITDLLKKGYSYLAQTSKNYFMVRTNVNGHKVLKTKQIF